MFGLLYSALVEINGMILNKSNCYNWNTSPSRAKKRCITVDTEMSTIRAQFLITITYKTILNRSLYFVRLCPLPRSPKNNSLLSRPIAFKRTVLSRTTLKSSIRNSLIGD